MPTVEKPNQLSKELEGLLLKFSYFPLWEALSEVATKCFPKYWRERTVHVRTAKRNKDMDLWDVVCEFTSPRTGKPVRKNTGVKCKLPRPEGVGEFWWTPKENGGSFSPEEVKKIVMIRRIAKSQIIEDANAAQDEWLALLAALAAAYFVLRMQDENKEVDAKKFVSEFRKFGIEAERVISIWQQVKLYSDSKSRKKRNSGPLKTTKKRDSKEILNASSPATPLSEPLYSIKEFLALKGYTGNMTKDNR